MKKLRCYTFLTSFSRKKDSVISQADCDAHESIDGVDEMPDSISSEKKSENESIKEVESNLERLSVKISKMKIADAVIWNVAAGFQIILAILFYPFLFELIDISGLGEKLASLASAAFAISTVYFLGRMQKRNEKDAREVYDILTEGFYILVFSTMAGNIPFLLLEGLKLAESDSWTVGCVPIAMGIFLVMMFTTIAVKSKGINREEDIF